MIDNFCILFSTLMMMYVIVRAAKLDRLRPWFETRAMYEKTVSPPTAVERRAAAKAAGAGKPRVPVELLTHGSANRR